MKIERRRQTDVRRVLIVDDEEDIRELLDLTLVRMGLDVDCVGSVAEAREKLATRRYQLCLTDMRLPDGTGLELVRHLNAQASGTPVAVITAHGNTENAVAALKEGAFDYIAKPVSLEQLRNLVNSALSQPRTDDKPVGEAIGVGVLIGDSPALAQVRRLIDRVARSQAPVHITGESGSGKELAAQRIHALSTRRERVFVPVNCGAIPENLMESEFFGYRKGAFTGASEDRDGFFQAADGGTLFLDEVAELPLAMQVKLLRAIQEKRVRRVGATAPASASSNSHSLSISRTAMASPPRFGSASKAAWAATRAWSATSKASAPRATTASRTISSRSTRWLAWAVMLSPSTNSSSAGLASRVTGTAGMRSTGIGSIAWA